MVGHKTVDFERNQVLDLLGRWTNAINKIDKAMDEMKLAIVREPNGMLSEEFEAARLKALSAVTEVRSETANPKFWPILNNSKATKIMLEMQRKLCKSYDYQL